MSDPWNISYKYNITRPYWTVTIILIGMLAIVFIAYSCLIIQGLFSLFPTKITKVFFVSFRVCPAKPFTRPMCILAGTGVSWVLLNMECIISARMLGGQAVTALQKRKFVLSCRPYIRITVEYYFFTGISLFQSTTL